MKKHSGFHDHVVHDVLADVPGITSRAMFGGYGIYKNGLIFAIIVDEKLYFKVADSNKSDFASRGMKPFRYTMPNGKPYGMSYWEVPEEVMENREEMREWVDRAVSASKNAKRPKQKTKRGK